MDRRSFATAAAAGVATVALAPSVAASTLPPVFLGASGEHEPNGCDSVRLDFDDGCLTFLQGGPLSAATIKKLAKSTGKRLSHDDVLDMLGYAIWKPLTVAK